MKAARIIPKTVAVVNTEKLKSDSLISLLKVNEMSGSRATKSKA